MEKTWSNTISRSMEQPKPDIDIDLLYFQKTGQLQEKLFSEYFLNKK